MKILYLVSDISPRSGGPAIAATSCSKAFVKHGHTAAVYACNKDTKTTNIFEKDGVRYKIFPYQYEQYRFAPELDKELKQTVSDYDLVHIHGIWQYPVFSAVRACNLRKVPYIIKPCGMLDRYCLRHSAIRKKIYYELIEKKNLRLARAIHFTSEKERNNSIYPKQATTTVVPLAIDFEPFLNLPEKGLFRAKHPELKNKRIILFLGRITFKKGLDLMIKAFAGLRKEIPNAHCVIAGPDDERYGKVLQKLITTYQLEQDVTLLGFVEGSDKIELLCDSDVFCLPSGQENFGIAVIEAMSAGLPVVISDQVNICDEVSSAKAGSIVSLNVSELEEALFQLLTNDSERKTMGENGRILAQKKYSWDHMVPEWLKLYQKILD